RHPAREVPEQHEQGGADGARRTDEASVHARRQIPYVSQAAPGDGSDPELVVSDVRSESPDVRRHLPCEGRGLSESGAPSVPLRVPPVVRHASGAGTYQSLIGSVDRLSAGSAWIMLERLLAERGYVFVAGQDMRGRL